MRNSLVPSSSGSSSSSSSFDDDFVRYDNGSITILLPKKSVKKRRRRHALRAGTRCGSLTASGIVVSGGLVFGVLALVRYYSENVASVDQLLNFIAEHAVPQLEAITSNPVTTSLVFMGELAAIGFFAACAIKTSCHWSGCFSSMRDQTYRDLATSALLELPHEDDLFLDEPRPRVKKSCLQKRSYKVRLPIYTAMGASVGALVYLAAAGTVALIDYYNDSDYSGEILDNSLRVMHGDVFEDDDVSLGIGVGTAEAFGVGGAATLLGNLVWNGLQWCRQSAEERIAHVKLEDNSFTLNDVVGKLFPFARKPLVVSGTDGEFDVADGQTRGCCLH